MSPEIAHSLGIGNSTGLGLGPYIVNHPLLFNNWIAARETAIARVRAVAAASAQDIETFKAIWQRSKALVDNWRSEHPVQIEKLAALNADIEKLSDYLSTADLSAPNPWDSLIRWSETALSDEGQEFIASLILEPYGDLVDDLAPSMSDTDNESYRIDGTMPVAEVRALIASSFGWALDLDWDARENCARAWYVSEEKLEPRVGERFEEPIAAYEAPLAPARDANSAHKALQDWPDNKPIAAFLLRHPEHRHTIRRAQISAHAPYSEIRDNTISAQMFPVDFLRVKLAFFGATHFDPRSDRWVRICMYGNAPYPEELSAENADTWVYPEVPS